MKIKIKKLNEKAVIPAYAHPGEDAGLDLVATSLTRRGDNIIYGTGLALEIPKGYVGLIFPRSSVRDQQLLMANSVGVVDSGYRGEIMVTFRTTEYTRIYYKIGDKIAQLLIIPYPEIELEEVQDLSPSIRNEKGHGSTK